MRTPKLAAAAVIVTAVIGAAGPAFAYDCINVSRKGTGGTAGTVVVDAAGDDTFTPSGQPGKPPFVRVDLSALGSDDVYVFVHPTSNTKHGGVVPGAKGCDGHGLDLAEECFE